MNAPERKHAFYIANVVDPGDIFAEPAADADPEERVSITNAVAEHRRNLRGLATHPINSITPAQIALIGNAIANEYHDSDGNNERAALRATAALALEALTDFVVGPPRWPAYYGADDAN